MPDKRLRTIDGGRVRQRRDELGRLSREELLRKFARLPGHSAAQAKRTWLSPTAIIDVIIWTEAGGG